MNPSSVAAVRVFTVTVAVAVAVAVAAARLGPAFAQPPAAAIEQGKTVFEHYCAACHGTGRGDDGAPMLPGTHALQLKYRGEKPGLLEERTDLPAELIKVFVRNGVASMPPFRKTEVTDEDIEAIAAYLAAAAQVR
jgi:mono/diheme cytochrome c family protein